MSMMMSPVSVRSTHWARDSRWSPACGSGGVPTVTKQVAAVTCRKCQARADYKEAVRKMATITESTEAAPVEAPPCAPNGMPFPGDTEESRGWIVEVEQGDGTTRQGIVRSSTYTSLKVHYPGECARTCCLDEMFFKEVKFVKPADCERCDSGLPFFICLCGEPLTEMDEGGVESS